LIKEQQMTQETGITSITPAELTAWKVRVAMRAAGQERVVESTMTKRNREVDRIIEQAIASDPGNLSET
jgi:hypothetical protein